MFAVFTADLLEHTRNFLCSYSANSAPPAEAKTSLLLVTMDASCGPFSRFVRPPS